MILTQPEIDRIVIPCNWCLIKLPQPYSDALHNHVKYQLTKDVNINIDSSFDPAVHAPRCGILIKNPKSLVYEKGHRDTMGWKCSIDTKEGDFVYFDYLACLTALGKLANPALPGEHPTWIRCENDLYVLLRYDALVLAMREATGEVIPLNGQVVLEPCTKEIESTLIIPDHLKKVVDHLKCKVVFVGKANEEYLDDVIDADGLSKDDAVIIKNYMIRMENSLKKLFNRDLVYVQQKNILAVL
jgi:co-chaperonin GroES (HSP10)